jgi:hypothetical protein
LLNYSNLPGDIWARLKTWAKAQALLPAEPSLEECERYVHDVCRALTGEPNALRPDVVAFYADEMRGMIAAHRATAGAADA